LPDIITLNQLFYLVPPTHRIDYNILRRRSMKPVKNLVYAVLLGAILTVSASAGDMATPGFTSPSPSPTPEHAMRAYDETLLESCDSNAESLSTETSDSLFYEALAALLSVY
jgi:hypothetical protein